MPPVVTSTVWTDVQPGQIVADGSSPPNLVLKTVPDASGNDYQLLTGGGGVAKVYPPTAIVHLLASMVAKVG